MNCRLDRRNTTVTVRISETGDRICLCNSSVIVVEFIILVDVTVAVIVFVIGVATVVLVVLAEFVVGKGSSVIAIPLSACSIEVSRLKSVIFAETTFVSVSTD